MKMDAEAMVVSFFRISNRLLTTGSDIHRRERREEEEEEDGDGEKKEERQTSERETHTGGRRGPCGKVCIFTA